VDWCVRQEQADSGDVCVWRLFVLTIHSLIMQHVKICLFSSFIHSFIHSSLTRCTHCILEPANNKQTNKEEKWGNREGVGSK